MKRKIAYIITTSALVMSAFLIGKIISTQPKPNAKQYLAVNDIQSIDYYTSENKLTINTSTDSYDFVPTVNVIQKHRIISAKSMTLLNLQKISLPIGKAN